MEKKVVLTEKFGKIESLHRLVACHQKFAEPNAIVQLDHEHSSMHCMSPHLACT